MAYIFSVSSIFGKHRSQVPKINNMTKCIQVRVKRKEVVEKPESSNNKVAAPDEEEEEEEEEGGG